MIALLASVLLLSYLIIPGLIFHTVFSLYIPLRQFHATRIQLIRFALVTSLLPLGLVFIASNFFGNYPLYLEKSVFSSEFQNVRIIIMALSSQEYLDKNIDAFFHAGRLEFMRNANRLAWFYMLVIFEAWLLGKLAVGYPYYHRKRIRGWIANKFLIPNISEWYFLFELFPGGLPVTVDILTTDDHLYRGVVANHFSDSDGKLTGILLSNPLRFDRTSYLEEKKSNPDVDKEQYWKIIPGSRFYLSADVASTINIHYEVEQQFEQQLGEIIDELDIPATVTFLSSVERHIDELDDLRVAFRETKINFADAYSQFKRIVSSLLKDDPEAFASWYTQAQSELNAVEDTNVLLSKISELTKELDFRSGSLFYKDRLINPLFNMSTQVWQAVIGPKEAGAGHRIESERRSVLVSQAKTMIDQLTDQEERS